jgi:hypothetical protein
LVRRETFVGPRVTPRFRSTVFVFLGLVALAGFAACERGEKATEVAAKAEKAAAKAAAVAPTEPPTAAPTSAGPTAWNAAALQVADQLAAKLHPAGVTCTDYGPHELALYDADYQRRVPLAAAITSCDSDGDEDITFQVFADAKQAQEYVATKLAMLCRHTAEMKLGFPGFPYVDGGAWIVEPDEKDTADKLAPILGGTVHVASCSKQ